MGALRTFATQPTNIIERLYLEERNNKTRTLVLVEGVFDADVFKNVFDATKVSIKPVHNCDYLILVHDTLDLRLQQCIIAIRDADFSRLSGTMINLDWLFYCDKHDVEMMCFSNNQFRQRFLLDPQEIDFTEIAEQTLQELHYLSMFKYMNCKHHNNYCFRDFKVSEKSASDLLDYQTIHRASYVTGAQNPAENTRKEFREEEVAAFVASHPVADLYEVTVGHDFVGRVCYNLKQRSSSFTNFNKKKVEARVKAIYDKNFFKSTQLYNKIFAWSAASGIPLLA